MSSLPPVTFSRIHSRNGTIGAVLSE